MSEIERQYHPSEWSKRLPRDIIIQEHLSFGKKHSEEVQTLIKSDLNIHYGPGDKDIYDIYGKDLEKGAPIFIFIHGGYWQIDSLTQNLYWFIAKNLYGNNIKSIFIEYEICPKVTLTEISENIELALKSCLEYAKVNKSRGIHLAGHSAGAHLVAVAFEKFIPNLPESDQSLFKSVFLLGGIYDLVPLLKTTINEPLKLDEKTAIAASPVYKEMAAKETVFYVVVAQYDCPAFVEDGKKLNEHLKKLGIKSKYVFIENVDHFDLLEKLVDAEYELTKLIIKTVNTAT